MKREEIYRDTDNWYLKTNENQAYSKLVEFAANYAGKKILDIGCATGDYCIKLEDKGFECVGIDIDQEYVDVALEKGVNSHRMNAEKLIFPDKSFDTVLLFEVLEHIKEAGKILDEAKRVAKKNILISVPNCTSFYELKNNNLTYEHMLEQNHVNFFTKSDLEYLLSKHFENFTVKEVEPIQNIMGLPNWLNYIIIRLSQLKLIKTNKIYYRLISVVEV